MAGAEEAAALAAGFSPHTGGALFCENHRSLEENNGHAYRSSELKVSFKSIYQECLAKAKEHFPVKKEEPMEVPAPEPVVDTDPRAGYAGEEEPEAVAAPRFKGPQLPGATVGAMGGDSSESEGEEKGPRTEGEERAGVDLRYVDPIKSGREEWMTMAPDSVSELAALRMSYFLGSLLAQGMAGLFVDGNGMIRKRKADVFAVQRSKEDSGLKRLGNACGKTDAGVESHRIP